jgi:uncharacterized membrane protein YkvI
MKSITSWFVRKYSLIGTLGLTLAAIGMQQAYAAGVPSPIKDVQQLNDTLCYLIIYFFWIVMAISVIMVLYAAFTYVTARDDVEKTSRARRTLTYAAIGIAVALMAVGFPQLVGSIFPPGSVNMSLNLQCSILGG